MEAPAARSARIFLSSTFRDFAEERDLLVRRVFPSLRARLRERCVEIVDVDLRWGITAEQAERGEVLPICLAEIDRSRPFFVGMLGERYGWVPPVQAYGEQVLEQQPWLRDHLGGASVTELEILHGVLNDPQMTGRAFFYFRSADYARDKGRDYLPSTPEDAQRLAALKERIRRSGFPVVEDYPSPEAFAQRLEEDLWSILDGLYPADDVPDAFEREGMRHEAYALPRRRPYLGGERYLSALDKGIAGGTQRVLVEGQSGGGKSALLANWAEDWRRSHPGGRLFEHYTGASADAADPASLCRRLVEWVKRMTGSEEEIPSDPQALFDSLPTWLAIAGAHVARQGARCVLVLDGLNGLLGLRDLRWFPSYLPPAVQLVVSCLPGRVHDALLDKGDWQRIEVAPLSGEAAATLLREFLARYNKSLPGDLESQALAHPLSSNPLFLRTLAEELRLFGVHEELQARLDHYLKSGTVDDLFELVLERVEADCGTEGVRRAMEAIWASRAGLAEPEIQGIAGLVPATWAPIRYALDEALLESGGRIGFAHDYLRIALSDRYMAGNGALADDGQGDEAVERRRQAHRLLGLWFGAHPVDARAAEEVPYQWHEARDWERLEAALTGRKMFEAILEHRGQEELLSWWLALERETGARLETNYEAAWGRWALDETLDGTGVLAMMLAGFLKYAGRYGDFTDRIARLGLEITSAIHGDESIYAGACLNNLALMLQAKGDYASAEPLFRRAVAIAEKVHGPEHPDTGACLDNLAGLLRAKGDYAAAEPLYRRALAVLEKAQGPDHTETGTCLDNLAGLLRDKGDYASAEPLFRRAVTIAEKALGPDHPGTGTFLNNLAGLLQDKGDYAAAEPLYRRALAIAETVLGPDHPNTGTFLNNFAGLLEAKGDYAAAEPLFHRALAIAETAQGLDHPATGMFLNNLAGLLQAQGDYASAEPLYRRALAIAETAQGPDHPNTGAVLYNFGYALVAEGRYDEAEPLLFRAMLLLEARGDETRESLLTSLQVFGVTLRDAGRLEKAEPYLERALTLAQEIFASEPLRVAPMLSAIGQLRLLQERFDEAELFLQRCLEIRRTVLGPDNPLVNVVEERLEVLRKMRK